MATRKATAEESGAQKGRTRALKAMRLPIKLSEVWPWLLLMVIGFICVLAQVFGLFHEGIGKYLYISACAWAMAFGFIGFVGHVTGKMKTMEEELRDSKPVAGEELHAELEAGSPDYEDHSERVEGKHPDWKG